MRLRTGLLAAAILACIVAYGVAEPARSSTTKPTTQRIVFLHVNDCHGQTEGFTQGGRSVGGYARLSTAVNEVRARGGVDRVFLIHAGDEFSRGDGLTTASAGAANITIMNHLRFDIWTPGNGDFYNGLRNLGERIAQARFKTLAANVMYLLNSRPLAEDFVIEQAGAMRIAFVGLCTVRTTHPSAVGLKVNDPVETAKKLVPALQKQADMVVVVSHLGMPEDQKLAAAVAGIDLIIGGHSHTLLPTGKQIKSPDGRNVLICQAGELLRYMGQVDLTAVSTAGRWTITDLTARVIPLNQNVKIDPAVTALIARLSATTRSTTTLPATQPATVDQ